MANITFGQAIGAAFAVPGGTVAIFEGGIKMAGPAPMEVEFQFPRIGRPSIPEGPGAQIFEDGAVTYHPGSWPEEQFAIALQTAFDNRIALLPVGGGAPVKMRLGTPKLVREPATGLLEYATPVTAALAERVLYDVAVLGPDGGWQVIAPHCVYYRLSWNDFGIAHLTDIHVSRRIDQFAPRLMAKGRAEAAKKLVNFNDRFRGFIKYANYLHAQGKLDVILATGDITDYQNEDDDPAVNPGGNPQFMRELLLGRIASSTMPEVEELRVPIFMVPGNHDYRRFPYSLLCKVKIAGQTVHEVDNKGPFRLSKDDAIIAEGHNDFHVGPLLLEPSLDSDEAQRMLLIEPGLPGYKTYLVDKTNYVVKLGSHRMVMLDSGPDTGLPTETEAILDFLAGAGLPAPAIPEDATTAIDGSPNSLGVGAAGLRLVVDGLADPAATGVFIVGLHAPLFNPWNEEYPYFLRETQRAEQKDQVYGWMARQDLPLGPDILRDRHKSWFAAAGDPDNVGYLKRGDPQDLLDYGVSRGATHDLMKAIAGIGLPRKADVVLHGHIHRYCDFRLGVEADDLVYYTDFYTENFAHYYPARYVTGYQPNPAGTGPVGTGLPPADREVGGDVRGRGR